MRSVHTVIASVLLQAEAEVSEKEDLYPQASELIVGAIAFAVLFVFMWRWVLPRVAKLLDERRQKIQGELEKAEAARREAEAELARYREQLANARKEANRIIEEGRRTAEQLRADLQARAEQEAQATVARATEEIRAERDRVLRELSTQVGQIAVELAGRVVEKELDKTTQQRLVDEFIKQVAGSGNGKT
jgi:F-type H+-transporting ATPase subunit b